MKTYTFHLFIISLLILVASCSKSTELEIDSASSLISPDNLNIDEYVNDFATHSSHLEILNSSPKKLGVKSVHVTLKSSKKEIIDKINPDWIKFKYNELQTVMENDNNSMNQEITGGVDNEKVQMLTEKSNILIIEIEGWSINNDFKDGQTYPISLNFDKEMKSVIDDHNIQLIFKVNPPTEQKKYRRWLVNLDKVWVTGYDYTRAWYYYTLWRDSSPTYYHSYKYFRNIHRFLPYSEDVVAVCCYNGNYVSGQRDWKTMKYVSSTRYIPSISFNADFCLNNGHNTGGPCYIG